jgi:mono/diheme cytochrome c family protein
MRIALCVIGVIVGCTRLQAAEPDFVADVQPIFARHCVACHGPEKQKSGYRLDVRELAFAGGDFGEAAIVAGKSADSPLVRYISGEDADMLMPPKDSEVTPLSAGEVATIRAWIDAGAVWPSDASAKLVDPRDWWSLKPLPETTTLSSTSSIDTFHRAKLAENDLAPAPEASRRTLIRRLSFDLIGLPPTPEEVEAFVADSDPQAYEKLVDRLLASPHYGERWARHWLDVVHFGETHGYDKDRMRLNAWPYRDYVIRALNDDKPYARFVEEQIAGDALWPDTQDGVEALGFIAAGPWDSIGHAEVPETKVDGKIARHLDRDDMVANTINTFCSLTVHCAQCHNHKFDPISQEDYYSLQAVFAALDRADKAYDLDPHVARQRAEFMARERPLVARQTQLREQIETAAGAELKVIDKRIQETDRAAKERARNKQSPRDGDDLVELRKEREELIAASVDADLLAAQRDNNRALADVRKEIDKLPKPRLVYAGTVYNGKGSFIGTGAAGGKPRPIHLLARGDVTKPGKLCEPGAITAIEPLTARFELPADTSETERRAALAHWITDPRNPLTWRSIVNRVWQYHFGRGIVDTPNDFGRMGALPSHPELLDALAVWFRDEAHGSLKQLHRLIVTSAAYRQSSNRDANPTADSAAAIDADNHLLWRQNGRKLEAEAMRDAILAVSGKLDATMGGPSYQDFVVEEPNHSPHYQYHLHDPASTKTHRRSIYRFLVRSKQHPWMMTMDCADPSMLVDKRNQTITPLQALAQMNNAFVLTMADHFAARVEKETDSLEQQVARVFVLALQRPANDDELRQLAAYARQFGLANTCRLVLNLNEFVFVD